MDLSIPYVVTPDGRALSKIVRYWADALNATAPAPLAGYTFTAEAQVDIVGNAKIRITAKPDQQLLALPEGSSYLGFIFARADAPAFAERSLREAHARLRFRIDPTLEILNTK